MWADLLELVLIEHDPIVGQNVLRELAKALRNRVKLPAARSNEIVDFVSGEAPVANVSPGGIANGIVPIPLAGTTVADIDAALQQALGAMTTANVPMRSPYWLMHATTQLQLASMRNAQTDNPIYNGMPSSLLGLPVIGSNNMPVNETPDPDETSIMLIDASEVLLADDGPVTIDVSREASLQLDSTPATPMVSLWQQNMLGIKAELYRYWQRRRDAAVQVISQVPLSGIVTRTATTPTQPTAPQAARARA